MKKIIYTLTLLLVSIGILTSCSNDGKIKKGIESYLLSKTMGIQVEFNFQDLKLVEKYTVDEVIKDYYKNLEFPEDKSLGLVLNDVNKLAKEMMESDPTDPSAIAWKFKSDRIDELSKKPKNDIEYFIVKTTYNFKNPILNNTEVEIIRYFILNSDYKVIAAIDEDVFFKRQEVYNKTPLMKYELSILSERNNIDL